MESIRLYIALLWRTLAALFLCRIAVTVASVALFQVGIEVPPLGLQSSVTYLMMKPSIAYMAFGLVVLISEFAFPANIVRSLGGERLALPSSAWRRYSIELSLLFFALAILNVFVAFTASVELWINYKLFGTLTLLLVGIYVLAYRTSRSAEKSL